MEVQNKIPPLKVEHPVINMPPTFYMEKPVRNPETKRIKREIRSTQASIEAIGSDQTWCGSTMTMCPIFKEQKLQQIDKYKAQLKKYENEYTKEMSAYTQARHEHKLWKEQWEREKPIVEKQIEEYERAKAEHEKLIASPGIKVVKGTYQIRKCLFEHETKQWLGMGRKPVEERFVFPHDELVADPWEVYKNFKYQ